MVKTKKQYPGRYKALALAFLALTINFWAWALLSPLASQLASDFSINQFQLSMLLAIPVILGALGRIPLGVLTDKYGGKAMFVITSFLTAIPVIVLSFSDSYQQFIVAAAFLGLGGASFAIGIPFVNSWFVPEKRGLALGLYSMGNAGTAVSGFLTPQLADNFGRQTAYLIVAVCLVLVGIAMLVLGKNAPGWKPPKGSSAKRLGLAASSRITWDLSLMYSVSFGAFVAFGVYLPMLLKVSYDLTLADAAARAGGFILVATLARPFGGWLSDKYGGQNIVRIVFVSVAILASVVALQSTLNSFTTVSYLSLAFVLGCGNGAIIALVSKLSKPEMVGSVTGIVGASGGLGGFLPPLLLGFTYQKTNSYTLALLMLAVAASLVFIYINRRFRSSNFRI